ncbi:MULTISPECIES: cation:proton antiporter [unclassified Serratia (in: enterobacteria)]|uniref:cation:proton antiporter n=1 Tax=unclassified Serratia (in: enterobacteria) TaxID=2647522 RepID=UPI002ED14FDF|nr:sodium:proton antiporter [Serratia sp. C2(2)]MEE4448614.1 sodium:proton antiporter [Serratia sp. C2(1)]
MTFLGWIAATGILFLCMSLASGWLHRGPITSFGLYLLTGIVCGPWVLDLIRIDVVTHAESMKPITDVAMAASLFITGLKLRQPFSTQAWRIGCLLAFPTMLLTVLSMMVIVHYLTGLPWALSLAFGAIVAPTDPVLASLISVNNARDDDSLRSSLSVEAGLNDGSALPFLLLALLLYGSQQDPWSWTLFARWGAIDVIWALCAGLLIGYSLGWLIGMLAARMRHIYQDSTPNDLIALALIALSYAAAQYVDASGFLAAFAAGVGLRQAEKRIISRHPPDEIAQDDETPPAEELVNPNTRHSQQKKGRAKSVGLVVGDAISFGGTLERLFAAGIVIVLGVTLAQHWDPRGLYLGLILFVFIRPITVFFVTLGNRIPPSRRILLGWFGIRGIGSINYIAYAYLHGMKDAASADMVNMALTLVITSVVLHGITVAPILNSSKFKNTE